MTAFDKLNKLYRRYSIQQTEMCENSCFLEAVIYNGMGDFTVFKGEGRDLDDALKQVLDKHCEYYGISLNELEKRIAASTN